MKVSLLAENDNKKVILKEFAKYDENYSQELIQYIAQMSDQDVASHVAKNDKLFAQRHRFYEQTLSSALVKTKLEQDPRVQQFSGLRKSLLSHFFVHEYSVEAAALFNPSIVPSSEKAKYIISYRATGEGHISSIEFAELSYNNSTLKILPRHSFTTLPETKLENDDCFSVKFSPATELSERVIFPAPGSPAAKGFEDLRLVFLAEEDLYIGHFTAYDGKGIRPFVLKTKDFLNFEAAPLRGKEAVNKNFAFFPRKINGKYALIARQDGYSNFYLESERLDLWESKKLLIDNKDLGFYTAGYMGNCGAPVETAKGWLLPIHGVGPFRRYTLSFILLDLDNPLKVLAKSAQPFLEPDEEQREGYVPNVLYTCGVCLHERETLLMPFAASDYNSYIAEIKLDEIWAYLGV